MSGSRTCELAARKEDGLSVVLRWHAATNALSLTVADARSGVRFEVPVPAKRALDAFYHPFAFAPGTACAAVAKPLHSRPAWRSSSVEK